MTLLTTLTLISSAAFLYYGIAFLIDTSMKAEFERFGLGKFKPIVGYLQLLGAVGLLVGLKYVLILSVSSAGLSLLMLLGFGVRLKMKDGLLQSAPSFIFMLLNLYIFIASLGVKF